MNDNEKKELIEVVEQLELKSKNKNRPSPLAITIYMDMLRKNIGSGKCYSILEALKKCNERSNPRYEEMKKMQEKEE